MFSKTSRPTLHPTTYAVGTRVHSWVKQPSHGVYHSVPSIVEVKNEWSWTSTPLVYLHGVDRESFTYTSQRIFRSNYEDQ